MIDTTANTKLRKQLKVRIPLVVYDIAIFLLTDVLLLFLYQGGGRLSTQGLLQHSAIAFACIFGIRYLVQVYRQIWRYGGIQCYIRLLLADGVAFVLYQLLEMLFPLEEISFVRMLAFCCMNLLGALAIRMIYRYAYKCGYQDNWKGKVLRLLLRVFSGGRVVTEADPDSQKIKIAIIGAGTVGVSLAEDLWANPKAKYVPRCFIDSDPLKVGRSIHGVSVMSEDEATMEALRSHHIQEVVFAVPAMPRARKMELFEQYQQAGFKIKVFDFPTMEIPGRKRQLREFNIEDLLMREQKAFLDEKTCAYYKGKVILITGGGGSIGSELCRQLAKMEPKQLIVVDIYENTAYDLQQGLLFAYKGKVDIKVEIVSITNKEGLARVFEEYHPDICINAAAHKHVPLMEKNCIEAVQNNVFGTLNVIQLCEEYGCGRFMMVSTDKAVNPTNVMGATKRLCEMVMQAYSTRGKVKCSATRFGNVLGSAGSVIPLFKRQIAAGGPVTLTDKRIIRYFMTIPEASQLVLVSGAMAKNGELFVLDMGKPVKIYDLAKNMIQLSGVDEIEIVETGLRPGEKLYEELLVNGDSLEKTDNNLIFVEHEEPVTMGQLEDKLAILRQACKDDEEMRRAIRMTVPTYRSPEEVNRAVS
ncbi:MAG: nucleoside-diphosphate sugar epimerase/dehydratase [Clostridiales bacterium]|nr:nucleoside-diphosphate sugar epimerase/dehydratase [Clostridiales bacterium]